MSLEKLNLFIISQKKRYIFAGKIHKKVCITTYYCFIDMYALLHSPATMTEGFLCFCLSCKANARV